MARKWTYHDDGVCSYVRGDGKRVYYVRYTWNGKRRFEKVGLREDAARGRALLRKEQREDPTWIPPQVKRKAKPKSITFAQFKDEFVKLHAAAKRSELTWFVPMADRLSNEFGREKLDEITHHRLVRWLKQRSRRRHPATINHEARFLKNMFRRAIEWGYLTESPAEKIKMLFVPPHEGIFLSAEQSDALIVAAERSKRTKHIRPLVQAALLTGMRRGELLGLEWPQIDLKKRLVHLRHTKSGHPRHLGISDDLAMLLRSLPRHTHHDRVFTMNGRPLASLKHGWDTVRNAAGLPGVRFHDLRHTWASRLVASGVDLYELMSQGGWRSITMVQRYAHFAPERTVQTAQLLNGTARLSAVLSAVQ